MKMLQTFNEQQNLQTAQKLTFENTYFENGFSKFLEALLIEDLIEDDSTTSLRVNNYKWVNEVAQGGLSIVTTKHPYAKHNEAGTLTIIGQPDSLQIVKSIMERHNVQYDGAPSPQDIEIKVEYHDTLNPKLWEKQGDTYELYPDVLEALESAGEAFFEFLEMPDLPIEDVTITGSSANYNWTDSSDLDLHLVVDMKAIEKKYGEIAPLYFNAQKKVWNDLHDINIKGVPVEFYVQDMDEKHHSTGIYSLKDNDWVLEPTHEEPDIDDSAVKAKASELMSQIDKITSSCNKADAFEKIMTKLRDFRQAGLEKAGEFSTENLVFKVLRANGYLDKIADCRTKSFDRDLSVEEEEWDNLRDDPWTDIGYTKGPFKPKSNIAQQTEKRTRINLNVPYSQRESARKAGAKWDPGIRKWYMLVTNQELEKIPNAWR